MILKQALKTNERSYFWQNLPDQVSALGMVKEEEVYHFSIKKNEHKRRVVLPKPEMS